MTLLTDMVVSGGTQKAQTVTPKAEGARLGSEATPHPEGATRGVIPQSDVRAVINGQDTETPAALLSEEDRQSISRQLMYQHLEEENASLRETVRRLEEETQAMHDRSHMKVSTETASTEMGTTEESESRSTLTGDSKSWIDKLDEIREADRKEREQLNVQHGREVYRLCQLAEQRSLSESGKYEQLLEGMRHLLETANDTFFAYREGHMLYAHQMMRVQIQIEFLIETLRYGQGIHRMFPEGAPAGIRETMVGKEKDFDDRLARVEKQIARQRKEMETDAETTPREIWEHRLNTLQQELTDITDDLIRRFDSTLYPPQEDSEEQEVESNDGKEHDSAASVMSTRCTTSPSAPRTSSPSTPRTSSQHPTALRVDSSPCGANGRAQQFGNTERGGGERGEEVHLTASAPASDGPKGQEQDPDIKGPPQPVGSPQRTKGGQPRDASSPLRPEGRSGESGNVPSQRDSSQVEMVSDPGRGDRKSPPEEMPDNTGTNQMMAALEEAFPTLDPAAQRKPSQPPSEPLCMGCGSPGVLYECSVCAKTLHAECLQATNPAMCSRCHDARQGGKEDDADKEEKGEVEKPKGRTGRKVTRARRGPSDASPATTRSSSGASDAVT